MMTIRHYPDPVLRQVATPVEVIDDELRAFAREMIETMYAGDGVGLAAPQVGVSKRMFVIDVDPETENPQVLINPVFVKKSRERIAADEGCLSVPGITASVTRPARVTVEAQDLNGNVVSYEGDGLLARALQHENDHLDGILFIDKLPPAAKRAVQADIAYLEDAFAAKQIPSTPPAG